MVEQDLPKASQAARLLLAVRAGAPRIAALPAALAPQDLAGAYAIQLALLEQLDSGIAGWKASLFSENDGACAPLPANAVVDAPAYAQVLHPPLLDPAPYGIEAEVAFRLGRDLPPLAAGARYERAAVCAAVVSAHAVIEVIATRFVKAEAVSKLELIADQLLNSLLVVGPSLPNWQSLPLGALRLEVRVQGHPVHQGVGGHPQGDPLIPLVWLANHLSQYGRGLRAGRDHHHRQLLPGAVRGRGTKRHGAFLRAGFRGRKLLVPLRQRIGRQPLQLPAPVGPRPVFGRFPDQGFEACRIARGELLDAEILTSLGNSFQARLVVSATEPAQRQEVAAVGTSARNLGRSREKGGIPAQKTQPHAARAAGGHLIGHHADRMHGAASAQHLTDKALARHHDHTEAAAQTQHQAIGALTVRGFVRAEEGHADLERHSLQ